MAGFRIATFNLENLGEPVPRGRTSTSASRLLRPQLVRLRADVLCLQEMDSQRPEGGHRRLDALDALLDDTPYRISAEQARSAAAAATSATSTT